MRSPPVIRRLRRRSSAKDRFFSGEFDAEKLEQAINAYAREGWRVVSMAAATIPGFAGDREELVVLMARDGR